MDAIRESIDDWYVWQPTLYLMAPRLENPSALESGKAQEPLAEASLSDSGFSED